jgi:Ca2+-binding RTX toxin-like protein
MNAPTRAVLKIGVAGLALALSAGPMVRAQSATTSYEYDAAGRLKSASYPRGRSVAYAYDAAGNRTSVTTSQPNSIVGTPGNDSLVGNSAANTLEGLDGNDTLEGGDGADELDGGNGIDVVSYAGASSGVYIDFGDLGHATGAAQGDTLIGIEGITGSAHADVLGTLLGDNIIRGGAGADQLYARAGNDLLEGGAGADVLDGGDGLDTASYGNASSGVYVFFGDTGNATGDAQGDLFTGIEALSGSAHNDILGLNDAVNWLYGGSGNDQLYALGGNDYLVGGPGADFLNGGDGIDTASYAFASGGVYVFFGDTGNATGEAAGDTFAGIENLVGSSSNDILGGGSGANHLDGLEGDDRLYGQGGDDTLTGGPGADRYVYLAAGFGHDTVTFFADGWDKVDFSNYAGLTFGQLTIAPASGGVLVTVASDSILLKGVSLANVTVADFVF